MTRRELLISQAEAFAFSRNLKAVIETEVKTGAHVSPSNPTNYSRAELMADFVIDRFNAFFDHAKMENNDEEEA
jgi:hypothetical protein